MSRLSLAAGSGGFSSCGAELCVAVTSVGSRVRRVLVALGLSSCDSWDLSTGSVVVVCRLSCLWHVESWTRDRTCVPYTGRRIPHHWTPREVQDDTLLQEQFCKSSE